MCLILTINLLVVLFSWHEKIFFFYMYSLIIPYSDLFSISPDPYIAGCLDVGCPLTCFSSLKSPLFVRRLIVHSKLQAISGSTSVFPVKWLSVLREWIPGKEKDCLVDSHWLALIGAADFYFIFCSIQIKGQTALEITTHTCILLLYQRKV